MSTASHTLTSDNTPLYTIGITANLLGVCQATLRLWEKKGLVEPSRLGKNRLYSKCNIDKLREIKRMLHDQRLNIVGVKQLIEKSFCWEIKNCSLEERESCPVYRRNKDETYEREI